ncbi:MAG: cell division protein FtsZ [Bacteroidia bacterium]|jgi:cell division protein FtsZ
MMESTYEFAYPNAEGTSIIKVIGVGGGGSNAVNHMFRCGIKGVDFYVCNTDAQALNISPVPNRIQLGLDLTAGLGAGAKPEVGMKAAQESKEQIREMLGNGTKMVFITAGMGGGTGTGAAPVIAEVAKELGILTVGIVTRPFKFEGKPKTRRADDGVNALREHCDTVLEILNDKLREVYGKASFKEAFAQADNVLLRAAKSIAEIITVSGNINVDFEDVRTVMQDAGQAVMGSAIIEGEDRAKRAAEAALSSPLLNSTNIRGAKYILMSIVVANEDDFQMEELEEISDYVQEQAGEDAEIIFGQACDESVGKGIGVTIIATGFDSDDAEKKPETRTQHVFDLESSKKTERSVSSTPDFDFFEKVEEGDNANEFFAAKIEKAPEKVVHDLYGDYDAEEEEAKKKRMLEEKYKMRQQKLEDLKLVKEMSNDELKEKQDVPAYLRKGVKLDEKAHSSESSLSRYNLSGDNELLGGNKFLHDNVD